MKLFETNPRLLSCAVLSASVAIATSQSWQPTTSYPLALYQADITEYAGKIYVAGGLDVAPIATVSVGTLGVDGSVLSWTATTPLPSPNLPGLAAFNGWVYAALTNGAICRARILPGGGLDAWITETQAVDPSRAYSTVLKTYNGSLYLFGRWETSAANVVRIAPIRPDGSVGAWSAGSLPMTLYRPAVQFLNNRVYLAGGLATIYFFNDVWGLTYSAPVFADGSVGAWRQEADLLARLWMHTSVIVSNQVYIIGGLTNQDSRSVCTTVFRGTIQESDGSIRSWPALESMPSEFVFGNSAVYSPFSQNIYMLGGASAAGQMTAQVWRKPLGPPPPRNRAPQAAILVSPIIDLPGFDSPTVLARSPMSAKVLLNARQSNDPDGDSLTFEWKIDGAAVSADMEATADLGIGKHVVGLTANDGKTTGSDEIVVQVVGAVDVLNQLISAVANSSIPEKRKTPLLASLNAAEAALNRGNQNAALNQLVAFQHKLSAQIAGAYPDLANLWGGLATLVADTVAGQP